MRSCFSERTHSQGNYLLRWLALPFVPFSCRCHVLYVAWHWFCCPYRHRAHFPIRASVPLILRKDPLQKFCQITFNLLVGSVFSQIHEAVAVFAGAQNFQFFRPWHCHAYFCVLRSFSSRFILFCSFFFFFHFVCEYSLTVSLFCCSLTETNLVVSVASKTMALNPNGPTSQGRI